jgi:hypothetical protein
VNPDSATLPDVMVSEDPVVFCANYQDAIHSRTRHFASEIGTVSTSEMFRGAMAERAVIIPRSIRPRNMVMRASLPQLSLRMIGIW